MPSAVNSFGATPNLATFLKASKNNSIESGIELLVSLLQRRQIRNSRQCALATAHLLLRVIGAERVRDVQVLIKRVRSVGRRLISAQPREMAVGNIVRRVLGIIREVAEEAPTEPESEVASPSSGVMRELHRPALNSTISSFSPLHHSSAFPTSFHSRFASGDSSNDSTPLTQSFSDLTLAEQQQQRPALAAAHAGSLFGLFQQPGSARNTPPVTGNSTPIPSTPTKNKTIPNQSATESIDLKSEILSSIRELLDELDVVDSQIAESALDHIHSGEVILTNTSSQTVQRFLAAAARKRKFTVIVAETWPNDHLATHSTIVNGGRPNDGSGETDESFKPLTALGTTVILIPDSAVFALMSRINKVILAPHTVLANGSLLAASGSSTIALAARAHRVPVVVLSGIYKLSPVYPFDTSELIEWGDPSKVIDYADGELVDSLTVSNPIFDHVSADLIDLYITNLGGHAPSYLYRIVADHYRPEDVDLISKA
ncbi:GCD complex subunit gcd7 [Oleoguttula sp. CCFEE 5521]